MHRLSYGFALAYHGCDAEVAHRLIDGEEFRASDNDYDWLGPGVYFWEANPTRGLEFADEARRRARGGAGIRVPAVVGAVLDLGLCLDLSTALGIEAVRTAHATFAATVAAAGHELPRNEPNLFRRFLDCAVMRSLHQIREKAGDDPVDTIKGIFVEGGPLYPGSGFHTKTHVQICVRNRRCIKGVFRVPDADLSPA